MPKTVIETSGQPPSCDCHGAWKAFTLGSEPDGWKDVGFDDSAWEGVAAAGMRIGVPAAMRAAHTYVPSESLLYRREYWVDESDLAGADVVLRYAIDNDGTFYVNGTQIATLAGSLVSNYDTDHATTLPRSAFRYGFNCIAIETTDDGAGNTSAALHIEMPVSFGQGHSNKASRCDHHHRASGIGEDIDGDMQTAIDSLRDDVAAAAGGGNVLSVTRVYRATSQNVSGSLADTSISFSNESRDDDGCWAIGTPTKIIIPAALDGRDAELLGQVLWSASTSGAIRQIGIKRNGSLMAGFNGPDHSSAFGVMSQALTPVLTLAEDDEFELYIRTDTTGIGAAGGEFLTWFQLKTVD